MLTISIGVILHLDRVILGDALALRHVVTLTTDRILLVPMTYAGITGILVWRRVRFVNRRDRALFTDRWSTSPAACRCTSTSTM